ncbi:muramidase [Aspergillus costaricaensis CBS 115574]|uniref:Muramidase n=1 Tax=Aspergillus costaricaensis CBS 115574 TaxID=1448317 RepID=A0ACD1IK23_9EURO|nr:muramidase [Aspergillus costaricaensis CBS 115574]RAK90370.1 muramidase [Aspergillus costaricaensis CBS 115574]
MIARSVLRRRPYFSNKPSFLRLRFLIRPPAPRLVHITPPFIPTQMASRRQDPSKRTPEIESGMNNADELKRLLDKDNFKKWGFLLSIKLMIRFYKRVEKYLQYYNGLDLLARFTPTVLEDRSFEGMTVASLRDKFNKWAVTAVKEEQEQEIDPRHLWHLKNGRYRFFIMIDQEALESILSAPDNDIHGGFVRLVNAEWKPEELDEEELAERGGPDPEEEPLEGCTEEDVGWMKVCWGESQMPGYVTLDDSLQWDRYYSRPPVIQRLS